MTENHAFPITPPPELVQQWVDTYFGGKISQSNFHLDLATRAAAWGADQELEACCEWLAEETPEPYINALRSVRRPKPPSLKEQALESVKRFEKSGEFFSDQMRELEFIRKALETIDD
jgi:hypothetical protein